MDAKSWLTLWTCRIYVQTNDWQIIIRNGLSFIKLTTQWVDSLFQKRNYWYTIVIDDFKGLVTNCIWVFLQLIRVNFSCALQLSTSPRCHNKLPHRPAHFISAGSPHVRVARQTFFSILNFWWFVAPKYYEWQGPTNNDFVQKWMQLQWC